MENHALKDLIEKKALGPLQRREAVKFLRTHHLLSSPQGLRQHWIISIGLVPTIGRLDRA